MNFTLLKCLLESEYICKNNVVKDYKGTYNRLYVYLSDSKTPFVEIMEYGQTKSLLFVKLFSKKHNLLSFIDKIEVYSKVCQVQRIYIQSSHPRTMLTEKRGYFYQRVYTHQYYKQLS